MAEARKCEFKTEIKQLLDIITHSLYTNKEIFLRELISNASDALDKLRYAVSGGVEVLDADLPQEIRIALDKDNKLLTVADTGIGMTADELVENIGTIAHSGSADFLKKVQEEGKGGADIIGRFGVGFYSVFMVASRVVLRTRAAAPGSEPLVWSSDGQGEYVIEPGDEGQHRGTVIEIHLKDEETEYAEKHRVQEIVKKHSNFISFPIMLEGEKINTTPALWREPKFNVKPEQYEEFYKFLTLESEGPLETMHHSVDAPVQFNSLVFVPKHNYDTVLLNRDNWGLDLYVKRVLIQHQNKDLIPEYLSFLRGVVDTEDLPLNVSRQNLQENRVVMKIRQTVVKQVLSALRKLAVDDKAKYAEFWKEHAKVFKFGYSDFVNRDAFAELLRFESSQAAKDELVSLDEYVARAKAEQKEIYYILGPSREALSRSPHLEIFRKKGVEVLYLFEPVDEFCMDSLHKFKEFDIVSAENADLAKLDALPDAETADAQPEEQPQDGDLPGLLTRIKDILGDKVQDVRVSRRLSDSPACLASPDGAMSSSMEKMMKMISKDTSIPKKVLEINPRHELTRNMLAIYRLNPDDGFITLAARQLFEASLLQDGYLSDPHELVGRINEMLSKSSGWYLEKAGAETPSSGESH